MLSSFCVSVRVAVLFVLLLLNSESDYSTSVTSQMSGNKSACVWSGGALCFHVWTVNAFSLLL